MKKSIKMALLLPSYQEEENIPLCFERLQEGVRRFPEVDFLLFLVDDGSSDGTFELLRSEAEKYGFRYQLQQNTHNLGLVPTLKKSYKQILEREEWRADWVVKMDADRDLDQAETLSLLLDEMGAWDVVVAIRVPDSELELNPYEQERRRELFERMETEIGRTDIDPASCGAQCYRREALERLMAHPVIQNYQEKWGFDFLAPMLLLQENSWKLAVRKITGRYSLERRGSEKVREQYDQFLRNLDLLKSLEDVR